MSYSYVSHSSTPLIQDTKTATCTVFKKITTFSLSTAHTYIHTHTHIHFVIYGNKASLNVIVNTFGEKINNNNYYYYYFVLFYKNIVNVNSHGT